MIIDIVENNLALKIDRGPSGEALLLFLGCAGSGDRDRPDAKKFRLVELQCPGFATIYHHGSKHTGTSPGCLLTYASHGDGRTDAGRKIEIVQVYGGLSVTSHLQFYDGIPVVRGWTEVANDSGVEYPIEYVSSFALTGISSAGKDRRDAGSVNIPHSTWYGEAQWREYPLNDLGYHVVNDFSAKRINLSSTGTWPCGEHLPMGSFRDGRSGTTMTWQIETAGSWNWEISDESAELYLQVAGPSFQENGFMKILRPGEKFAAVPCAVAFVEGDFSESIRALTAYRRRIRRPNGDNANPSVIFNDYMNCLWGDPTTEKEKPLIDAAARAGCLYYCVDCGWYADGLWWDGVGEWMPSGKRFPGGIGEVMDRIRERGMIPGLWLELEVMGINSPMAKKVSPDWFFRRNGAPVIDEGRYQLDFRNAEVRAHATSVVRRLVNEYGVGYIKNDYNINAGVGTDFRADSAGDGLLQHTRAWLDWLDGIFLEFPDLVVENCGSGGMRMEYSLLSRCSIQSVTDQTDYLKMAAIAANCMTAVTPEQAAVWSYPLRVGESEEAVFNMVNAMLFRIHQSGHLAELEPSRADLVAEGIRVHKRISAEIKEGLPFWPIGLASMTKDFCAVGVLCRERAYLAVWHVRGTENRIGIPLSFGTVRAKNVKCIYPESLPCEYDYDAAASLLALNLLPATARLFQVDLLALEK